MTPQSKDSILASIIISSYNYAEYLPLVIDSALGQTYRPTEVIVVDDGSKDRSIEIMKGYGGSIRSIFKENGGQASAWNTGFAASKGEIVFFVDSDDLLTSLAVEKAMEAMKDPAVVKVQWQAWEIDAKGKVINHPGARVFEQGDLKDRILAEGPYGYVWPPSSQNAWRRDFLNQIMPMPEKQYVTCPDLFLAGHAPLFGLVKNLHEPLSSWRMHEQNSSWRDTFENRARKGIERDNACADSMASHCARLGIPADREKWNGSLWWAQIFRAIEDIDHAIPAGAAFMLDDKDEWGCGDTLRGRRRFPFKEQNGVYWGSPETDEEAIVEIERQRADRTMHIAFVWPHLWRLENLSGLKKHLESRYHRIVCNDRSVIYDLRR
jgi:glycosyltransferase involved in cell wall biosynthesis